MADLDHLARHAEGPHHEPDGLGAPQFFTSIAAVLIVCSVAYAVGVIIGLIAG